MQAAQWTNAPVQMAEMPCAKEAVPYAPYQEETLVRWALPAYPRRAVASAALRQNDRQGL